MCSSITQQSPNVTKKDRTPTHFSRANVFEGVDSIKTLLNLKPLITTTDCYNEHKHTQTNKLGLSNPSPFSNR